MKAKTFGKPTYLVSVYFVDEFGRTQCETSKWSNIENARDHYDYYTKMIGKESGVYEGKIIAVTSFKANQCLFE